MGGRRGRGAPLHLAIAQDGDFDGLNYFYHAPFAFPWVFLPIGTSNNELDAYILAFMGLANAVLLYFSLRRRRRKGSGSPDEVPASNSKQTHPT